jgi:hypothetical protein
MKRRKVKVKQAEAVSSTIRLEVSKNFRLLDSTVMA